MAWIRFGRTAVAVAVAVAAGGIAACTSSQVTCPCPSGLRPVAMVAVPSAQTTTIDSIMTDTPCMATEQGTGTGIVLVARANAGTCTVRVDLGNGNTYTFSVQFRVSGSGCCGDVFTADASVPELVDAGMGGAD